MATRLYLTVDFLPSSLAPTFDSNWQDNSGTRRWMVPNTVPGNTLTTVSRSTVTPGNTVLHRQYVSPPMAAGNSFTTSTTYKCQIMGLESAANDNIINRVRVVKIISADGGTVRSTQIAFGNAASVTEWNTALRNLSFLTGQTGANYTTVAGDRLLLEVGHDDSGGSSISGSLRWGADSGGTGDLGENETDTTTTLRPWFETSLNVVWEPTAQITVVRDAIHRSFSY